MVLSKGLLISLGFTFAIAVLLFFYVRQRTNAVENKINTLIQFVQTETMKLQNVQGGQRDIQVYEQPQQSQNVDQRIDVSDDSSDDDSDSESYSDSDSDSDNGSEYSSTSESDVLESTRMISMNNLEAEQLNQTNDFIELNVLRPEREELSSENTVDLVASEELKEEITTELTADLEALTISDLSDGGDDDDDEDDDDDTPSVGSITNENGEEIQIDYRKMLVKELRAIVEKRGLAEDTKKMKKKELLKLLVQ
jgi:hypothetical protein